MSVTTSLSAATAARNAQRKAEDEESVNTTVPTCYVRKEREYESLFWDKVTTYTCNGSYIGGDLSIMGLIAVLTFAIVIMPYSVFFVCTRPGK